VLARTQAHFWPDLPAWMAGLKDTRDQERITYSARFLLHLGLMVFLAKCGSRRQVKFELQGEEALANLNRLAGAEQEAMAHPDTLDHYLGHLPESELPGLRRHMVVRLIRMKALDDARLFGHFPVVIDGTGQLYFPQRHCEHCLTKTVDGKTQYFHHVLEAKLVTPQGLAISIGTEFIENTDPKATKQDCELKAFARLAKRLKKDYPQLLLCLLLDGLYANGTAFDICRENHWKYIITFKEGSLPALWRDYQDLLGLCPQNRKDHCPDADTRQSFAWVNDLEHRDDHGRTHRLAALQCHEKCGGNNHFFAWLTNFTVTDQSIIALANRGGRCRWKIENQGFNIQKNGGFNLEHAYSLSNRQIKNYYLLMQIAHLVLQLIEMGSLIGGSVKRLFGSLRNLARRLAESLRHYLIPPQATDPLAAARIQIRLNSS
jgi:hypothetical protein